MTYGCGSAPDSDRLPPTVGVIWCGVGPRRGRRTLHLRTGPRSLVARAASGARTSRRRAGPGRRSRPPANHTQRTVGANEWPTPARTAGSAASTSALAVGATDSGSGRGARGRRAGRFGADGFALGLVLAFGAAATGATGSVSGALAEAVRFLACVRLCVLWCAPLVCLLLRACFWTGFGAALGVGASASGSGPGPASGRWSEAGASATGRRRPSRPPRLRDRRSGRWRPPIRTWPGPWRQPAWRECVYPCCA